MIVTGVLFVDTGLLMSVVASTVQGVTFRRAGAIAAMRCIPIRQGKLR
jgi:hypothetical protein